MNTGQESQSIFEIAFNSLGKDCFLERRVDLAYVRGMNPTARGIKFPAQPSDYLLTVLGRTHYAEVKSTTNKTSFPFAQIEPAQWAAARRSTAAGGSYLFFLHSLATNRWFCVPAVVVLHFSDCKHSSLKWTLLDQYAFNPGVPLGTVALLPRRHGGH